MTLLDPTLTQKLIWLDQLITDSPSKYNIGGYALFEGMLDPSALEAALKAVLRSQEIYSAIFLQENNVLRYYIKNAAQSFSLRIVDMSERANGDHFALQWMEEDFSVPFVLEDNYLFRLVLIKVSESRYYCYAKLHHLIKVDRRHLQHNIAGARGKIVLEIAYVIDHSCMGNSHTFRSTI